MTVGVSPRALYYYRQAYKAGSKVPLGNLTLGDRFIWDPKPAQEGDLLSFPDQWEVSTVSNDGEYRYCRPVTFSQEGYLLSADTMVVKMEGNGNGRV